MPDYQVPTGSTTQIKALIYADDILLLASSGSMAIAERELNGYLNILCHYFTKWHLKLNASKCTSSILKGPRLGYLYRNARRFQPSLFIYDRLAIKYEKQFKYLGVVYDEKLNFKINTANARRKACAMIHKIQHIYKPISSNQGNISHITRICALAYKKLIQPVLMYGYVAWMNIKTIEMEELRRFERKILRKSIGTQSRDALTGHYIPNKRLYKLTKTTRIDRLMFQILEKLVERDNTIQTEIPANYHTEFLTAHHLTHLMEMGIIYDEDENLIFHHRRHRSLSHADGLVFNTSQ
ncbi:GL23954 [Drosophila persimilis]|uniref:GL23954 n=1 Tax=Drosophila persimilis TaxID=7234 RepID=B4G2R5_DROPE|nr:GL23954 [Drosophila persimilis]